MRRDLGPYPAWLRIWHWNNATLFLLLLLTGLSMHYAGTHPPIVDFQTTVLIHNSAGILLTLCYGLYLFGILRLGNGRYYRLVAGDLTDGLLRQTRYYLLGIFLGEPHPYPHGGERKFNPLQKLSYLAVMFVLFPLVMLAGWALLFPTLLPESLFGMPGIGPWAIAHTYLGFFMSLFMLGHAYLGTTGETVGALFWLMLTGHETPHPPPPDSPPAGAPDGAAGGSGGGAA